MIIFPVILAASLRRRAMTPWILFSLGSLTFVLSQVIHLPLNSWLADLGFLSEPGEAQLPIWREALTLGLTAGLCEELMRAGGYALLLRFKPTWMRLQDAAMLGLGHGGIEAMIFGGVLTAAGVSALLPLQGADLDALGLNLEQLATLQIQLDALISAPYSPLVPLAERILAMAAHVTFSLLVWRAFASGRIKRDWYFIGIAVLYHTMLDAILVYSLQTWPDLGYGIELVLAGIVLPGFGWAVWIARREGVSSPHEVARSGWGVFWVAVVRPAEGVIPMAQRRGGGDGGGRRRGPERAWHGP
jgi:uncharacterized membrane protein YhfC